MEGIALGETKGKSQMAVLMEKQIQVIPARTLDESVEKKQKLRVAAYCRVSTEQEEQLGSFANQVDYYTRLIDGEDGWQLAGIYADEGISGTGTRRRKGFQQLMDDCEAGKVDFVITKSISRFARNTADCLVYARRLKDRGIPILFQKESINTMEASGELMFTILSCFAQEESRSISENTKWGIRSKFLQGIPHVNATRLYGFEKCLDGQLRVDPEQGKVVARIFREYLDGYGAAEIARQLRKEHIPGSTGTSQWSSTTVRRMLQNEKYKGDLLLQKYYTVSFLTGECVRNEGALDQYLVTNAHEGIVPRLQWEAVQEEMRRRRAYRRAFHIQKLEADDPLFNKVHCQACGSMVVRGYGKKGRAPFRRCHASCRKHHGTTTRTVFTEDELQLAMWTAGQQLWEQRAERFPKWQARLESTEASPLEKVRTQQMLDWMEHWQETAERRLTDQQIRRVLRYMIAGEGAFTVYFLDGSEVKVSL